MPGSESERGAAYTSGADGIAFGASLPSSRPGLIAGAVIGAAVAVFGLDPAFIVGNGAKWLRPEDDFASYLVAWNYYVADAWRLPIFSIPAMGYPEGGSVLFNDALPLGQLASKVLHSVLGWRVNPFGWCILLTHVLQGVMAARLLQATGVRSILASASAATLVLCSIAFLHRMGHIALSSHFLVLWALALHVEMVRQRRARIGELTIALAIALLVNAYLFAMVAVIGGAALLALRADTALSSRELAAAGGGALGLLAIGLLAGYGVMFSTPALMQAPGYGLYSWNVATLLLPRVGPVAGLAGVTRDATGGQYEGEAYVGGGALLVLLVYALSSPRRTVEQLQRYWPLCLVLLVCALYAASNRVYVGSRLLAAYSLPQTLLDLCSYFRASGRFIWPLSYALTVLPLAAVCRTWRPAPAAIVVVLAVLLQLTEAFPLLQQRRLRSAQQYEDMLSASPVPAWMASHSRLWMYPAWPCGGLGPSGRQWGGAEANRELQIQLTASRDNIPTNSVYTSRMLKDCQAEAAWATAPRLEPGVLYLLNPEVVAQHPALAQLAQTPACTRLTWVTACSAAWSGTPSER